MSHPEFYNPASMGLECHLAHSNATDGSRPYGSEAPSRLENGPSDAPRAYMQRRWPEGHFIATALQSQKLYVKLEMTHGPGQPR